MLIPLTQQHITNGQRGMCYRCAVALAFKDAGLRVAVNEDECKADTWDHVYMIAPNLGAWIRSFDRGQDVCPVVIEVDHEDLTVRIAAERETDDSPAPIFANNELFA